MAKKCPTLLRHILIALLLVSLGTSCRNATTTDILPDSCSGVVTMDCPRLLPKLLKNKGLVDSIRQWTGISVSSPVFDWSQPMYLFEKELDGKKKLHFLAAILDERNFASLLQTRFPKLTIQSEAGFQTALLPPVLLIWNSHFLLAQWYNPMTGQIPNKEELVSILQTKSKREFEPQANPGDISFEWKMTELAPHPFLPTLDAKVNGYANLESNQWHIEGKLDEHQYLSWLKAFPVPAQASEPKPEFRLLIWPELESIWRQWELLILPQDQSKDISITPLLRQFDQPFSFEIAGKSNQTIEEKIHLRTSMKKEAQAKQLEQTLLQLLPKSIFGMFQLERTGRDLHFFHQAASPMVLPDKNPAPDHNQAILIFEQNLPEAKTRCILHPKTNGNYAFQIDVERPECLPNGIWNSTKPTEAMSIFDPFLP